MSFGMRRYTLVPGTWTQISTDADSNVTIDSTAVGAYQNVHLTSSPQAPTPPVTNVRTLRAQDQQVFTNLDQGTVLWATACHTPVDIEVLTG